MLLCVISFSAQGSCGRMRSTWFSIASKSTVGGIIAACVPHCLVNKPLSKRLELGAVDVTGWRMLRCGLEECFVACLNESKRTNLWIAACEGEGELVHHGEMSFNKALSSVSFCPAPGFRKGFMILETLLWAHGLEFCNRLQVQVKRVRGCFFHMPTLRIGGARLLTLICAVMRALDLFADRSRCIVVP